MEIIEAIKERHSVRHFKNEPINGQDKEKLVLAAQMQGLNTCWVAGTYKKGKCKASLSAINQQKFLI